MKQLAIMISVPGTARADVLLTVDRVYYRFATEETLEDGDLPGLKERYLVVEAKIKEALKQGEGEKPLPADKIKVDVFVDNVRHATSSISEQVLKRVVAELQTIDQVFQFLNGFL